QVSGDFPRRIVSVDRQYGNIHREWTKDLYHAIEPKGVAAMINGVRAKRNYIAHEPAIPLLIPFDLVVFRGYTMKAEMPNGNRVAIGKAQRKLRVAPCASGHKVAIGFRDNKCDAGVVAKDRDQCFAVEMIRVVVT